MPTVIDSLVVTLDLDPKKFNSGQKESDEALKKTETQADKTNKAMEEGAKKAANAINKVRNEVLGLVAAFLGVRAVISFGESITNADVALGYLATNVGMSTVELSAWEGAAERVGGTADDMGKSISNLANQMAAYTLQGKFSADVLNALTLSGVDIDKYISSASITEKLLMLADALHKKPANEAMYLGQIIGLGPGTTQAVMAGREALVKFMATQKQLNVVTEANAEAAKKRKIAWLNLADQFEHIGRVLITQLSPAFLKILGQFSKWLGKKENLEKIVNAIKDIAKSLENIDLTKLMDGFSKILDLVLKIADAVAKYTAPGGSTLIDKNPEALTKNMKQFGGISANAMGGIQATGNTSKTNNDITININTKDNAHSIADGVHNELKKFFYFSSNSQAGAN